MSRAMPSTSIAGSGHAATPSLVEGQDFSPDKQIGAKRRTSLPEAVAKPTVKRQFVARNAQANREQESSAMTAKQVTIKTRCFHLQLIENTRPRHKKGVNLLRIANKGSRTSACATMLPARVRRVRNSRQFRHLRSLAELPDNGCE